MTVSVAGESACVRIAGRANFSSSIDFKTLVNGLYDRGCKAFIIDLTECTLMDSTFLGVLAGLGLKVDCARAEGTGRFIELFNPNSRIAELLENLGVLHLFEVAHGQRSAPDGANSCEHIPAEHSREALTLNALEAHRLLMDLHPDNVARFKDVAAFLADDLKKLKAS
jgi:anti-anti-sigma regulatory factor